MEPSPKTPEPVAVLPSGAPAIRLSAMTQIEREVLYKDIATAIVNHIPAEMVCMQYRINKNTLRKIMSMPAFVNVIQGMQLAKEENARVEAVLSHQEFVDKARSSYDAMLAIQQANTPGTPESIASGLPQDRLNQTAALKAAEFILKEAGFGITRKEEKTVTHKIDEKDAELIQRALNESTANKRMIIDVTPIEVEVGVESGVIKVEKKV